MIKLIEILSGVFFSAGSSLIDYLSFHVLLCLVPAFFIAGAMTVFIPTDSIMKYIGPEAKNRVAYPLAAIGGLLLAVCSCTVIPLFVGIYKKGAGLGPAITFLFAAPAVNILALVYTGTMIGMDIALARAILAIFFAVIIGLIMAFIFPTTTEGQNQAKSNEAFGSNINLRLEKSSILIILLNLFAGISLVLIEVELLLIVAYLIGLITLVIMGHYIKNKELNLFLWLVFILFVGTSRFEPYYASMELFGILVSSNILNMFAKIILVLLTLVPFYLFIQKKFDHSQIHEWFYETWIFTKSIFPLIVLGVVIAGAAKFFIPQELIIGLVGTNSLLGNLFAVFFGVFMYFPTLMEVPIARMFLDLGMAKGPLLAYLLADPELSIQSILVTRKYLGDKKNIVYVFLVAILTTISGILFGLYLGEGFTWF